MNLSHPPPHSAYNALAVGRVSAGAAPPRHGRGYPRALGSEAAAADNPFLYILQRCTAAGTSTAVTLQTLNPADAATEQDCGQNHTVEPTYTANQVLLDVPLNQRATFRWEVNPERALVSPATAANGIGIRTPTSSAVVITGTVHVLER